MERKQYVTICISQNFTVHANKKIKKCMYKFTVEKKKYNKEELFRHSSNRQITRNMLKGLIY